MTVYYDDGQITLYLGSCFDDECAWLAADVLVTDPPYGISYRSNMALDGPSEPIADDGDTRARDKALRMWGDKPALVFGTWKATRPAGVRQLLVWDKGLSPGMGDLSLPWGPAHEEIYVLGAGWAGRRRPNVLRYATLSPTSLKRPAHPTPKPQPLMVDLIQCCPPGVIADPFAGSGTTLRAAKDLGRKAIGVELNEQYCELAAGRLGQEAFDFGGVV